MHSEEQLGIHESNDHKNKAKSNNILKENSTAPQSQPLKIKRKPLDQIDDRTNNNSFISHDPAYSSAIDQSLDSNSPPDNLKNTFIQAKTKGRISQNQHSMNIIDQELVSDSESGSEGASS